MSQVKVLSLFCRLRKRKMSCLRSHCYWLPADVSEGRESFCQCRRCRICSFSPWVGKIPWSRKWQPRPVSSPGESHGQRSLVGDSPQGCKGPDTTERLSTRPTECRTWLVLNYLIPDVHRSEMPDLFPMQILWVIFAGHVFL